MVSMAFTSALEMFSRIRGKRPDQGDQAFEQMEKLSLYLEYQTRCHTGITC